LVVSIGGPRQQATPGPSLRAAQLTLAQGEVAQHEGEPGPGHRCDVAEARLDLRARERAARSFERVLGRGEPAPGEGARQGVTPNGGW
jgi:hypothetical protein